MAGWQRHAARIIQTRLQILKPGSSRAHHSISMIAPSFTSRGPSDAIRFPPVACQVPDAISSPSVQLMALPKRKVTPSRKGKRNGPKALKPIPIVAKCKTCGRIKLPHFYCCSGEEKVLEK